MQSEFLEVDYHLPETFSTILGHINSDVNTGQLKKRNALLKRIKYLVLTLTDIIIYCSTSIVCFVIILCTHFSFLCIRKTVTVTNIVVTVIVTVQLLKEIIMDNSEKKPHTLKS